MANTLTIDQVSTVLNAIVAQATGNAAIATADTKDFVTVAQTGLLAGYDPLIGAISQVLSRTIFSVRPYTRKFKSLEADSITYGNHVRKLNIADKAAQNDGRLPLTDGVAVDQQQVSKPTILQTNFYGAQTYERQYTIFKDQLDTAFSSPEEFARFISMVVQNVSDMIEQDHEQFARLTVANYIGGVIAGPNAANQVVHLLTEYNTATGLSLTATTVLQPANYPGFIKWAFARIAALSALLTERSEVFTPTSPVRRFSVTLRNPSSASICMRRPSSVSRAGSSLTPITITICRWRSMKRLTSGRRSRRRTRST